MYICIYIYIYVQIGTEVDVGFCCGALEKAELPMDRITAILYGHGMGAAPIKGYSHRPLVWASGRFWWDLFYGRLLVYGI